MTQSISISKIRIDGGTQARVELNQATVKDYAEAMKSGDVFDPVVVFFDGSDHWLSDGFHRYHAASRNKSKSIRCEVRKGTQADAQLEASGANSRHGLRRTNADKRRAVNLCLDALAEQGMVWTENKVANHCGVSHTLVADVRTERKDRAALPSRNERHEDEKVVPGTTQNPPSEPETQKTSKSEDCEKRADDVQFAPVGDGEIELPVEETMGGSDAPKNHQAKDRDNPKVKNGREKINPKDRTEAKKIIGQLVRVLHRIGLKERFGKALDSMLEAIEPQ